MAASKRNLIDPTLVDEGLILMDLSLQLIGADGGATAILSGLSQVHRMQAHGKLMTLAPCIPEEIKKMLDQRDVAGVPTVRNMRIHLGKEAYNFHVLLIHPQDGLTAQPILALYMQRDYYSSDAVDDVAVRYNLTARERETVKGIAAGLSSKELAERMSISPNTVKSFLRAVMLKMGTTTRGGIVSKILEHNNNHISSRPSFSQIDIRRPVRRRQQGPLAASP